MNTTFQFDSLEHAVLPARSLHLAIGMFDGVHLGHRAVIESALRSARSSGGLAGVLTFWPHPSVLFRPEQPARLILGHDLKLRELGSLGLDFLIEQKFTAKFSQTTAAEFVQHLRHCLPHLAAVYVGENWRFGRGREGDVAMLVAEARKISLSVFSAPRINHNGAPISSSRIRDLLERGPIEEVNALLGYPYCAEGVVQHGRELGRTIGFPTLNLPWEPDLKPRYGVYAVTVGSAGSGQIRGVANYGLRPTVAQTQRPLLEVHLLEASPLTYGDEISVQWLHFLRPEAKFSGLDELRAQIEKDRQNALDFFVKSPAP